MKVIISCLNSKFVHASLSIWCLAAGVREFSKKEYDVLIKESTINGDAEDFAHKIAEESPDVVAFSCYIWNITKTLEIARSIKQSCKAHRGRFSVLISDNDFRLNDDEALKIIWKICKCKSVADFQKFDKDKRNYYIEKLYRQGLLIRQISRLTGVSWKVVENNI